MGTSVRANCRTSTRTTSRVDSITHAEVLNRFEYNPGTGLLLHKNPPYNQLRRRGQPAGFIDHHGYRMAKIDRMKYVSGRLIWFYMTGEWPDEVDHKNLDRADDRWENLRESNRSQNCANKGQFFKKNCYGFRGVKRQTSGRFQAVVCVNQKEHYLGTFDTAELAALAYDMGAKKHHGEFARFNFPETAHRDWLVV